MATHVEGLTEAQVAERYPKHLSTNFNQDPWTKAELEKLVKLYHLSNSVPKWIQFD